MKTNVNQRNYRQERITASNIEARVMLNTAMVIAVLGMTNSFAQNNGVGGGNLCREEIEKHRAQIVGWIERDEARDLDFSKALVKGWTYNDPAPAKSYKRAMLEVLQLGKVRVNCYDDLDVLNEIVKNYGTPADVGVGGGCINYRDQNQTWNITCYAKTINQESDRVKRSGGIDKNYQLIHHEYASIAGVEKRLGARQSDFSISDQLSEFQHQEMVSVLGQKKGGSETTSPGASIINERVVKKSIEHVGDCELSRTENTFLTIDRYHLRITYSLLKMKVESQKMTSIESYSRGLFIGSPIEGVSGIPSHEMETLTFVANGTQSALELCQKVRAMIMKDFK